MSLDPPPREIYPTTAETQVINAAEKLMEEKMALYDPSHDKYHVQRVRQTALVLARSLDRPVDLLVVELAALFHDLLDRKYVTQDAASYAIPYFDPFFVSTSCHIDLISDGRAALVVKIVENVSWSVEKRMHENGSLTDWHNNCLELHCVQDADRLDAIGAFGIMRCAAYSCIAHRPLHVPAEDKGRDSTAIAHFHDKLLKIKYRLKTNLGKSLGEERHRLMEHFLDAVHKEESVTTSHMS